MLLLALFILGFSARLMPHLPNFAPMVAIALFSGAYLDKKYGLWIAVVLYILTDLMIGLHDVVLFTWSSILIITLIGTRIKEKKLMPILGYTVFSSILFFIVTNFGVWLSGWYPRTGAGLIQSYLAAIPFFRTSLISNLAYAAVLVKVYEFFLVRVKSKKLATALLLR